MRPKMTLKERLDNNYIPVTESGCWLWTGTSLKGYGKMNVKSRTKMAHRVAYEAYIGPIPAGMFVCHKCDVPSCINPNHLFVGTHADNMTDRNKKGNSPKGIKNGSAKYTKEQISQVKFYLGMGGKSHKEIACITGVHFGTISEIKCGRLWAD